MTSGGVCLNQKRQTKLALIRPRVDRDRGLLILDFPGLRLFFLFQQRSIEFSKQVIRNNLPGSASRLAQIEIQIADTDSDF